MLYRSLHVGNTRTVYYIIIHIYNIGRIPISISQRSRMLAIRSKI